ncbi:YciI family protein [Pelagibacterium xiamenense]|uniref:YciI family protein n=1 Tax=Pelagibacterium xiamenense TaxID=2901140 RepID=UPI001E3B4D6A|nr:YciI family protein [Pelagibacterium xiamenense]MCD7058758.1 YciI family protein [Pelagibacterium xiamenense]
MKYIGIVRTANPEALGEPPAALMEAIDRQGKEAGAKFLEGGPMFKTGLGRVRGGKLTLDGPYAETKEVVAGYAMYELESDAEMIEWTRAFLDLHRQHWPEWEGEVEVIELVNAVG